MSISTITRACAASQDRAHGCAKHGSRAAALATIAILMSAGLHGAQAQTSTETGASPLLGIYDPHGTFGEADGFAIEHIYMPWQEVDLGSVQAASQYALDKGRRLLITVEPWTWFEDWGSRAQQLQAGTVAGLYDPDIRAFCRLVGELDAPVTVRWGHEMELATDRYAWSNWGPKRYIAAYRHFVETCRPDAPNALFMWSPAGEERLDAYYPGDTYVDIVGISIFGLQQYDQDHFGRDRSFSEMLAERYARVAQFGKPIAVAELGCLGDDNYMDRCLREALEIAKADWPQLESVVYFNAVEPVPWPEGYGTPDWRVEPGAFEPTN